MQRYNPTLNSSGPITFAMKEVEVGDYYKVSDIKERDKRIVNLLNGYKSILKNEKAQSVSTFLFKINDEKILEIESLITELSND